MIKRKTEKKAKKVAKEKVSMPVVAKNPRIRVSENPDYKVVYASGVFGGLDANDSRIIFFLDRIKPKMKKDGKGVMELDMVQRELQVEVHMSPHQFIAIAKWMMEHAQRFGKKITTTSAKDSAGTSYIG